MLQALAAAETTVRLPDHQIKFTPEQQAAINKLLADFRRAPYNTPLPKDIAAAIGFQVTSGVTKKITLLVVGDQDIKKLAGHEKSSKHRKAEKLIENGVPIRILKESDFKELARLSDENA